jgi:hypothetical protein
MLIFWKNHDGAKWGKTHKKNHQVLSMRIYNNTPQFHFYTVRLSMIFLVKEFKMHSHVFCRRSCEAITTIGWPSGARLLEGISLPCEAPESSAPRFVSFYAGVNFLPSFSDAVPFLNYILTYFGILLIVYISLIHMNVI